MRAAGFHQLGSDFADDRIARIREKLGRGRHIGVEMSVNTSFNVAGPIAQTPSQAIDTLRRSIGLDVVLLVASDGAAYAAWHGGNRDSGRFTGWFSEWKSRERT
jgi:carbamoyltransferase